jgi:hypothetical protein
MPDGTRKRRNSPIAAKRRWYSAHRAERFARRFWTSSLEDSSIHELTSLSAVFNSAKHELAIATEYSEVWVGNGWGNFVDAYRGDPLVFA